MFVHDTRELCCRSIPQICGDLMTNNCITTKCFVFFKFNIPDNKIHGANMGPTLVLSAPDGPHVGPMKLAIRDVIENRLWKEPQLIPTTGIRDK